MSEPLDPLKGDLPEVLQEQFDPVRLEQLNPWVTLGRYTIEGSEATPATAETLLGIAEEMVGRAEEARSRPPAAT